MNPQLQRNFSSGSATSPSNPQNQQIYNNPNEYDMDEINALIRQGKY